MGPLHLAPSSGSTTIAQFFHEPALRIGLLNTLIYAVITSGLKVVLGHGAGGAAHSPIIARGYLRSVVFFPVLVSTVGVGITFTVLMHPDHGAHQHDAGAFGITGPGWLTDPHLALFSVALRRRLEGRRPGDVIYIAGIVVDPARSTTRRPGRRRRALDRFRSITLPLPGRRPSP